MAAEPAAGKRAREGAGDGGAGAGQVRIDTSRSGGVYIPPHKLARMHENLARGSREHQRIMWEALKKSINGLVNKVNIDNISSIVVEIFRENLLWGLGLLCRSLMKAQAASPAFTRVFAALVAVVNTKLPACGDLLIKRIICNFKKSWQRSDKVQLLALSRFLAHLVNQKVVHEVLALQMLMLLLDQPTHDSVEVAVAFFKDVGKCLENTAPRGFKVVQERFRSILQEGDLERRAQYIIEGLFVIVKHKFADYPDIPDGLDLVEDVDQITHELSLDESYDVRKRLDFFQFNPDWIKMDDEYKEVKAELLGDDDDDDDDDGEAEDAEGGPEDGEGNEEEGAEELQDLTGEELSSLRRKIYLTIMSSMSYEETVHKLLQGPCKDFQNADHLSSMLLECCMMEKTYFRYYGLMAERFCLMNRNFQLGFEERFAEQYATCHRLETNKLRNLARLFAHLMQAGHAEGGAVLPWEVLRNVRLTEADTTSSSRIFVKILFQELAQLMDLATLIARLQDKALGPYMQGIFPRDTPKNTRFAINFFTSIGLGVLTDDLRDHLKALPQQPKVNAPPPPPLSDYETDSLMSSSSSSESSSSSSSLSSSSSSEKRKKKKKKKSKKKAKKEKKSGAKKEEKKKKKKDKKRSKKDKE